MVACGRADQEVVLRQRPQQRVQGRHGLQQAPALHAAVEPPIGRHAERRGVAGADLQRQQVAVLDVRAAVAAAAPSAAADRAAAATATAGRGRSFSPGRCGHARSVAGGGHVSVCRARAVAYAEPRDDDVVLAAVVHRQPPEVRGARLRRRGLERHEVVDVALVLDRLPRAAAHARRHVCAGGPGRGVASAGVVVLGHHVKEERLVGAARSKVDLRELREVVPHVQDAGVVSEASRAELHRADLELVSGLDHVLRRHGGRVQRKRVVLLTSSVVVAAGGVAAVLGRGGGVDGDERETEGLGSGVVDVQEERAGGVDLNGPKVHLLVEDARERERGAHRYREGSEDTEIEGDGALDLVRLLAVESLPHHCHAVEAVHLRLGRPALVLVANRQHVVVLVHHLRRVEHDLAELDLLHRRQRSLEDPHREALVRDALVKRLLAVLVPARLHRRHADGHLVAVRDVHHRRRHHAGVRGRQRHDRRGPVERALDQREAEREHEPRGAADGRARVVAEERDLGVEGDAHDLVLDGHGGGDVEDERDGLLGGDDYRQAGALLGRLPDRADLHQALGGLGSGQVQIHGVGVVEHQMHHARAPHG
mmetsp:Transcript_8182/g.15983  ORF Transcript_8182/g.15983 Transcript_8182/m.15983 type:complete len:595 (+) Transcript_8182:3023-4807(+)